jgi:phytoene synthase
MGLQETATPMRREAGGDPRSLEQTFRERAAPAGSSRYCALLFAPADIRSALTALYAFDAELRAAVHPDTEHSAAHLKLTWWAEEIDRIVRGRPLHPIGRALSAAAQPLGLDLACLADYLVAAQHDLAGLPVTDDEELTAYCQRSGGLIQQLGACFAEPALDRRMQARRFGGALGRGLRLAELLRSHRNDLRAGRVRLPQSRMRQHHVTTANFLSQNPPPAAVELLDELAAQAVALISQAETQGLTDRSRQRAGIVLGALAVNSLQRMRSSRFAARSMREPVALTQLWRAWRAARNT